MSDLVKINSHHYNDFIWLLKAMEKSKSRRFTKCINASGGKLYVTDGKRIHSMDNVLKLEDGNYEVLSKKKPFIILEKVEEEFKFPPCESVIPKDMVKLDNSKGVSDLTFKPSVFISWCLLKSDCYVDSDYLANAFFKSYEFDLYSIESKDTLMLQYKDGLNKTAVLMARLRSSLNG